MNENTFRDEGGGPFAQTAWNCQTSKHVRTRVVSGNIARQKISWPSRGGAKWYETRDLGLMQMACGRE